jgi:hypothetical protein
VANRIVYSELLLVTAGGRAVHAVIARDAANGATIVVTVYVPSLEHWHSDWKTRKQP